jgi:hypothetical protein
MSKNGLVGVGTLSILSGPNDDEKVLLPKEEVFPYVQQNPNACTLVFRAVESGNDDGFGGGEEAAEDRSFSQPPRKELPNKTKSKKKVTVHTNEEEEEEGSGGNALESRVIEQEQCIGRLRKQVQQLQQIEREQQKIIDAQNKSQQIASSSMKSAMEIDKLQFALEEEKKQHQYAKKELQKLRGQKAEYLKRMKAAGLDVVIMPEPPGGYNRYGGDDNPEEIAGCDTGTCVVM